MEVGYIQESYIELGNEELDRYWMSQEGTLMKGGTKKRSCVQRRSGSSSSGPECHVGKY